MNELLHPKERFRQLLLLSQQLVIDLSTPGKDARDRALRNAKVLKDAVEAWVEYAGFKGLDLMKGK